MSPTFVKLTALYPLPTADRCVLSVSALGGLYRLLRIVKADLFCCVDSCVCATCECDRRRGSRAVGVVTEEGVGYVQETMGKGEMGRGSDLDVFAHLVQQRLAHDLDRCGSGGLCSSGGV